MLFVTRLIPETCSRYPPTFSYVGIHITQGGDGSVTASVPLSPPYARLNSGRTTTRRGCWQTRLWKRLTRDTRDRQSYFLLGKNRMEANIAGASVRVSVGESRRFFCRGLLCVFSARLICALMQCHVTYQILTSFRRIIRNASTGYDILYCRHTPAEAVSESSATLNDGRLRCFVIKRLDGNGESKTLSPLKRQVVLTCNFCHLSNGLNSERFRLQLPLASHFALISLASTCERSS